MITCTTSYLILYIMLVGVAPSVKCYDDVSEIGFISPSDSNMLDGPPRMLQADTENYVKPEGACSYVEPREVSDCTCPRGLSLTCSTSYFRTKKWKRCFCSPECKVDEDCPWARGSSARPVCDRGSCTLQCWVSFCPEGMTYKFTDRLNRICYYPNK